MITRNLFRLIEILCLMQEEHVPISKKLKGDFITYEEIASCKYTAKVLVCLKDMKAK